MDDSVWLQLQSKHANSFNMLVNDYVHLLRKHNWCALSKENCEVTKQLIELEDCLLPLFLEFKKLEKLPVANPHSAFLKVKENFSILENEGIRKMLLKLYPEFNKKKKKLPKKFRKNKLKSFSSHHPVNDIIHPNNSSIIGTPNWIVAMTAYLRQVDPPSNYAFGTNRIEDGFIFEVTPTSSGKIGWGYVGKVK